MIYVLEWTKTSSNNDNSNNQKKKNASACILPQLEDIPPIGPEDMGAGPSSPADRLGVSDRPPLEINELGCESVIKHLDYQNKI